ncbi:alpha/beta fold hydrolase [Variovorax saccharolyticus]|uniref:alpha/beta fold hydrolase n=1 Tax=Variovorax saccharolyticus TaxID=3053516 RepID=UPI0025789321|nr:alpha/beta hydrolase [Variovorax sp. J22R187]MDM0020878.1 alpha/beta hydrolase [Variovorax sp. J22R187]
MAATTFLHGANVRANGIRQHYLRYGGKGPVVVIVPGITSPAATWGFVAERFGQHFDTYVLDVRGRGLSEASDALDYGLDACAADVAAFAEALALPDYQLVGHSMGARIGIRLARQNPQGLRKLVLVDPPVSGPGRRRYPSQLPWYVDSIRLARRGITIERMREFCPTWTPEQLRLRAEWLHTCDERAIVTTFDGFHQDDIHADLPHVKVPTLLMVAGRGGVIQPEDREELSRLLPALQVADVPNAGHMIPWDDEEGFYQAFGGFLGHALTPPGAA